MKLYKFIKPDPTLKTNLMALGFDFGLGWFWIAEECFDKITEYLKELAKTEPEQVEGFLLLQAKEKYGTLRLYFSWEDDKISEFTREAEEKSAVTCESCGNPGELRDIRGWYMTICDECLANRREYSE